jgi:hypothetical protein
MFTSGHVLRRGSRQGGRPRLRARGPRRTDGHSRPLRHGGKRRTNNDQPEESEATTRAGRTNPALGENVLKRTVS